MQTRWPRKYVNGCVRLTQPNVSTEEMPVTTKLPCYPAHEAIIEDRPLEKKIHHCDNTFNRYYVRVASGNLAFHIAVQGGCRGESMIAGRSTITVLDNRYFYT